MNCRDRRVRKTKKALFDALATLMQKKDLRSITVKELADKADVHRATFYTHYSDIYDLHQQMEASVISDIDAIISSSSSPSQFLDELADYVQENRLICGIFQKDDGQEGFLNRICRLLTDKYLLLTLQAKENTEITEELRYLCTYNAYGCMAMINRWVSSHFAFPKERLIQMIGYIVESLGKFN